MGVTLHWHAHALRNLEVATLGGQLFSAGEEGVVVVWNLETQKPSFIPRVAATIRSFAVSRDGTRLFACGGDNSLRWVDAAQHEIRGEITGLALGSVGERRASVRRSCRRAWSWAPSCARAWRSTRGSRSCWWRRRRCRARC